MSKEPTAVLWTRLPISEAANVNARALAQAMTVSEYIRMALMGPAHPVKRAPKRTKRAKGGAK